MQVPASLRKSAVPVLLAGIAGLSVWLFQGQPVKGPVVTPQTQGLPDTFMENFTSRVMDARGRPHYQLQAAHMAHYADEDRSEFTRPVFTAFRDNGQRWVVEAERGRAQNGDETVFLDGAVIIQHLLAAKSHPGLEIRTRDVRVSPAKDYAETDQPASILRPKARLETVGMEMDFRRGQLQLLSQVRGVYAP
ncbi:MAG TPA: LPS export ABC transporter periplasmic protein LptC [Gammaproteobacteria bacterium]|nr:LPS export ABC transporter periplasmic protein LptC [Gammaproteobacteria bacterium]